MEREVEKRFLIMYISSICIECNGDSGSVIFLEDRTTCADRLDDGAFYLLQVSCILFTYPRSQGTGLRFCSVEDVPLVPT